MVRYGVSEGVMMMELMSENRLVEEEKGQLLLSSFFSIVAGRG